jgi:hypothetical protein
VRVLYNSINILSKAAYESGHWHLDYYEDSNKKGRAVSDSAFKKWVKTRKSGEWVLVILKISRFLNPTEKHWTIY